MFMPHEQTQGRHDVVVVLAAPTPKRVLFATAELSPICRVGGLADASAGLVAALRRAGTHVDVVVPDYDGSPGLELRREDALHLPDWASPAVARVGHIDGFGPVIAVRVPGIERPHPYNDPITGLGWDDNDRRFLRFSAAVAALAERLRPDVVHLNDWHTAAAAAWVPAEIPTILTIHNLVYQGDTDPSWLDRMGTRSHAFSHHDRCNPLAGGIELADRVVAVSPAYAMETRRPEHGAGLEQRLRARGSHYSGIRNGIDVTRWDPTNDPYLPASFGWDDLSGKDICRKELVGRVGFEDDGEPIIGIVSRFVDQKGIDLALEAVRSTRGMPGRVVFMGRGEPHLENAVLDMVGAHPDRIAYLRESRESLAHLVLAASDLFLVSSRFEPCGLTPMEAMSCGTIPIVTPVGGLRDSVVDASGDESRGNGFIAPAADPVGVSLALSRAIRAWTDPVRRRTIQRVGMTSDWSWRGPATAYADLYDAVCEERGYSSRVPLTALTSSTISVDAFEGAPLS